MADPLAATRRLGPALLDVPRGTPPLLVPRVRRLASVSPISLCSPHPGRGTLEVLERGLSRKMSPVLLEDEIDALPDVLRHRHLGLLVEELQLRVLLRGDVNRGGQLLPGHGQR